jgi:choline dehydrogenase-like flavoprotein
LAAERDDLGVRRGGLNWTLSPEDLGDIYTASRLVAGELMKQGLGPIYLEALPGASRLTGGFHHMGGTRMSESPEHGVVDENLRVHGVPNLYVVGSSVFPTSCFSNPTLTIVALAARLASHLAEAG